MSPQFWPRVGGDFIPLVFSSGWTVGNFGQTPGVATYGGDVLLRGVTKRSSGNITSPSVIAVLPDGHRPPSVCYFLAQGAARAVVPIQINADGSVRVKTAPSATTPWLSLDGIRFRM